MSLQTFRTKKIVSAEDEVKGTEEDTADLGKYILYDLFSFPIFLILRYICDSFTKGDSQVTN